MLRASFLHGSPMSRIQKVSEKNRLVDAFEPAVRARIEPFIQSIDVDIGTVICETGGQLDHVYFPENAVLSLLTVLEDGAEIETANIGSEGAYGVFNAVSSRPSFNRCLVQMQGRLLRVPVQHIRWGFDNSEHMRRLLMTYSEMQISQIQQSVACNARHSTEERISRWLLVMADRAPGKELPYTHEFLSSMLGANRKSVTLAAQALQTGGMIKYNRGRIRIVDRKGLERASCECYSVVRGFEAFLASRPVGGRELKSKPRGR